MRRPTTTFSVALRGPWHRPTHLALHHIHTHPVPGRIGGKVAGRMWESGRGAERLAASSHASRLGRPAPLTNPPLQCGAAHAILS